MKAKYLGETDDLIFVNGKMYDVECIFIDNYFVVFDEVGDPTIWNKEDFELIDCVETELDVYGPDPETKDPVLWKKGTNTKTYKQNTPYAEISKKFR